MATKRISLKLLVDKEQNQVVYAESGKDFVDVLFSFLTMPLGTVIRLTGKQYNMGCMSRLYEAVEDLDTQFLKTKACKDMLLYPKSVAEERRKNLIVDIDDTKPTQYYICSQWECYKTHRLTSTVDSARCPCGFWMTEKISKHQNPKVIAGRESEVFVKGNMRYMIRDDLQVSQISTSESILQLLKKHGISEMTVLEERVVNVGAREVLHLLKCLLRSKTPLTDVFLPGQDKIVRFDQDFKFMSLDSEEVAQSLTEKQSGSDSKKISVKLFLSKSNNKIFYAECGNEFTDLLFSFLAFPLGSIVKFLGGFASLTCLNNLHYSVELLSANNCILYEDSKDMLLDPKLAPYFSCDTQPLHIQEQVPWEPTYCGCYLCKSDDTPKKCPCGWKRVQLSTINPKYPNVVKKLGGAFTAGPATFMVSDELNVKPLSPTSAISLLSKSNVSISDLEVHVVSVGKEEALSLLKATLISSRTALSDTFILKKPKCEGLENGATMYIMGSNTPPHVIENGATMYIKGSNTPPHGSHEYIARVSWIRRVVRWIHRRGKLPKHVSSGDQTQELLLFDHINNAYQGF